ncbi:MAG TPA: isocitrate lyase/phosphoenolpyruvate mutase family protein, partial [Xanthobacteraceae bacterium]|nr:isocitrate lyase/phosphoenolpyruvate mutase family protein [Xanthobacteraceae bacterium]
AAGADCLYAPGLRTPELIGAVIRAVAPKPVNIIMSGALGLTVGDLAGLGARRISVGSALARVAWGAVLRAAKEIAGPGRFDAFAGAAPHAELNAFFRDDMTKRP